MRKVMVFGTFDGIHEGHRSFMRQAQELGDKVVAVVAQDHMVKLFKGKRPSADLHARMDALRAIADEVVMGDDELRTWEVLYRHRPRFVALGYDQVALRKELEVELANFSWPIELMVMKPYRPDTHHSSLLRRDPS